MRRARRLLLPFVMLVSVLLWAGSAIAEPTSWERVDVTLHSEQSGGVMLVSGQLPESTKLPAEAELSVPAGSSLQWVGQILGGDPTADPELTYAKSTVDGSDVYRFTLTKARIAQIEIVTSDAAGFDGTKYTPAVKWTATQAVPEVRLSARIPQSAQIVQAAPGAALQPGSTGYGFYTKSVKNVKPGDQLDMTFSYQVAATPTSGASTTSSGSTAQIIVILVAIAAGAFFVMAVRRKMKPAPGVAPETANAVGQESLRHSREAAQAQRARVRALAMLQRNRPPTPSSRRRRRARRRPASPGLPSATS